MYKDNKIKRNKVVSLVKVQNTFWWFVNRLPLKWWEQQIDILFLPSKCLIKFWKPRGKFGVYCNNEDYCGKTRVVKDKWKSIREWLMTDDVGVWKLDDIVRLHKRWWFETVIVELTAICALCFVLISPTLAWRIGNAEIRSFPQKTM